MTCKWPQCPEGEEWLRYRRGSKSYCRGHADGISLGLLKPLLDHYGVTKNETKPSSVASGPVRDERGRLPDTAP